ncbi:GntR family transcriptional regulator [Paracoccus gahaiensis]|uniref:GntR family transcriptional regulator n=1 Tax=Paracoccus gahaiensis TaxID=1706839 RepID=A0A4U0R9N5_9RHOB|nr:GntR family transcriptional regulator [Paracoccus gahaiensis]TJZ91785.1 GntR family transcriptional regulator [Paracoccus gahaiensis]
MIPIRSASTAQQVHDWLYRCVLRGDLLPGMRLSETEIAAQVGLSRQPVREAFIRLASDGLAEIRPQRGTYIGRISVRAVLSARLIREAVESDLGRMVARSRPDLSAMAAELDLQARADAAGDVPAFVESDDRFHGAMAEAAGHPAVWQDLERLKAQMNRMRHLSMRVFDRSATIAQHRAILTALQAGDGDAAETAIRTHLRQMLTELPEMARTHPDYFTD